MHGIGQKHSQAKVYLMSGRLDFSGKPPLTYFQKCFVKYFWRHDMDIMDEARYNEFHRHTIGLILLEHSFSFAASSFALADIYSWNTQVEHRSFHTLVDIFQCNNSRLRIKKCCSLNPTVDIHLEEIYELGTSQNWSYYYYHVVFMLSLGTILFGIVLFSRLKEPSGDNAASQSVSCFGSLGWLIHGLCCILFAVSLSSTSLVGGDQVEAACKHPYDRNLYFDCLILTGVCPRWRPGMVYLAIMIFCWLIHIPAIVIARTITNRVQNQDDTQRESQQAAQSAGRCDRQRRWVDDQFRSLMRCK